MLDFTTGERGEKKLTCQRPYYGFTSGGRWLTLLPPGVETSENTGKEEEEEHSHQQMLVWIETVKFE